SMDLSRDDRTGDYRVKFPTTAPGRYRLVLEGETEAPLRFVVVPPARGEEAPAPLAIEELRAAAEQAGGEFFREADLPRLPPAIRPQFFVRTQVISGPPWSHPG